MGVSMWFPTSFILYLVFCLFSTCNAYVEAAGANTDLFESQAEFQVALACNKGVKYHNQYMNEAGEWISDLDSIIGCLSDKDEILDYCKKVYPRADVTNVVESTHTLVIDDWCRMGRGKCVDSLSVRPYRCLVGKFQSDALLVPESCRFDHIHNSSRCVDFYSWNLTALRACSDRHMSLRSFAMLLPCGTDVFTGVEFVCCPSAHVVHTERFTEDVRDSPAATTQSNSIDTDYDHADDAAEYAERDRYFSRFDPRTEHSAFVAAQHRLDNKHRQKVSDIMKEWNLLEERYQKMRHKNPTKADKFKNRMTDRFQRMMNALKEESAREKQQLISLHQQRIVAVINEHKKSSLTALVKALNANPASEETIRRALARLMRALYKDRHHTIAHFNRLMSYTPQEAHREQSATVTHLKDLDRMINESMSMLDRYPEFKEDILPDVEELVYELRQRDTLPAELADSVYDQQQPEQRVEDDIEQDRDDVEKRIADAETAAFVEKVARHHASVEDQHPYRHEIQESMSDRVVARDMTEVEENIVHDDAGDFPRHSSLSSSSVLDAVIEPRVAHSQSHVHSHGGAYSHLSLTGTRLSRRNMPVVISVVVLVSLSVVTLVALVRRHRSTPSATKQGFTPVSQNVSPEERHITKMRVNGYENPTYKYFGHK